MLCCAGFAQDPALEPAVNGYVAFEDSHVRAFYAGGSKNTPAPKMGVEVVGSTGRIIMDDVGDGKVSRMVAPFFILLRAGFPFVCPEPVWENHRFHLQERVAKLHR
eukprot:COSAG06_NODE_1675_length_8744_cov_5.951764_6_plen_106_part_00